MNFFRKKNRSNIHLNIDDRSSVSIGEDCTAANAHFTALEGAQITVADNCTLGSLYVFAMAGARISVGYGCSFNGAVRLLAHEDASIHIGAHCLFAGGTDVTISDMHSIIDLNTNERINTAKDVFIDEHVWTGNGAMILKGARIGKNSIIGAGSIVTGNIPSECLAVGTPAKVIRTNVNWNFDLI
ncbi:acyltransferase [Roseibium sp. CAU 1637]|uniref:Acyltransferase n=1 Tax=Roseibium limicola TaxID=2816037 RepID=A0A939ETG8_9HYPH|nr:acyltransferase [Roseibium limicola]MBO0346819.1 acyltransferase [Roseibium limicola]